MAQAYLVLAVSAMTPRRSPKPTEVARLPADRCCRVGQHGRASANRTPGSHLRHAAVPPQQPINPTTASAQQCVASPRPSTVAAALSCSQPLLPSKFLRRCLLPLIELEP